jgi:long-chain acyl-CoA synthetase
MNIVNLVEETMKLHPERPALLFEGEATTYGELGDQVARAAGCLRALGVRRGDRVALFLPNIPAFVVVFLATVRIGAIAVPVNAKSTGEELQALLLDCGAEVLVTTAALREASLSGRLAQIRYVLIAEGVAEEDLVLQSAMVDAARVDDCVEMQPDDPAAILYTSGTTGRSKGAALSHRNIDFVMRTKVECMGVTPEDRLLLFLPISHCFGLNAVLNAALAGGACVILHRRFEIETILRSIERDRATMFFGVPTTFILMLQKVAADQLRPLRYFFSAADILPREVEERWMERFGFAIYQGYGLTESSPFATYNHLLGPRQGSVGVAVRGVEIAIGDPVSGRLLKTGERGEVLVRGPNVMLGYWGRPEETALSIRDGWLHSGDIGRIDDQGYLTIEDRLKDMVIVGGVNVYSAEVERVLSQHPGVLEIAVYGKPDEVLGERVCAAIVQRVGQALDADSLKSFCSGRLAEFKIPSEVEIVTELPKGPTGKVLKRVLRERNAVMNDPARMWSGTEDRVTSSSELEERIARWLAEALDVEEKIILRHVSFSDFGVTSLMAVELAGRLCGWLGRSVPPTIAWQFSTVRSLARHFYPEAEPRGLSKAKGVSAQEGALILDEMKDMAEAEATALLHEELRRLSYPGRAV